MKPRPVPPTTNAKPDVVKEGNVAGPLKDLRDGDGEPPIRFELQVGPIGKVETTALELQLKPGDAVSITKGAEVYCPIKYNTVTVGPVTVTSTVGEGETATQAYMRVQGTLTVMFQAEFDVKVAQFFSRLEQVVAQLRKRGVGKE